MDAISSTSHPDVVMIESTPRPTPTPARVSFGQVLAAGANGLVQGAELAASVLPGSPIAAAAVRGGGTALSSSPLSFGLTSGAAAEGVTGIGTAASSTGGIGLTLGGTGAATGTTGTTATDPNGSIDASIQQSAQMNLYYLQIQQEVDAQNRSFTTLSNVLKTEHDSAKAAIQNVHS